MRDQLGASREIRPTEHVRVVLWFCTCWSSILQFAMPPIAIEQSGAGQLLSHIDNGATAQAIDNACRRDSLEAVKEHSSAQRFK